MKKLFGLLCLLAILCVSALADSSSSSGLAGLAGQVQGATSLTTDSFFADVLAVIGYTKGGVPLGVKIAGYTLLLIALMKVSFLASFWAKLGKFQAVAAPVLGLALGLSLLSAGGPLTGATIMAYLASGAGAIAVHEILDMIKAIPGLGSIYVTIINFIEGILGGAAAPAAKS